MKWPRPWSALGLAMLLALALAGCAGVQSPDGPLTQNAPKQPPDSAQASTATDIQTKRWSGNLSLKLLAHGKAKAQGLSLAFDLQGQPQQGALDLSTPLGTLFASVRWEPAQASLYTSDGQQSFASLDVLIERILGERLPVPALMSWLQGRPDPAQTYTLIAPQADIAQASAGQTQQRFEQAGWQVDASDLDNGVLKAQRAAQPDMRGATLTIRLER